MMAYERKEIYPVEYVLGLLHGDKHILFDGDEIDMTSRRYFTFEKSLSCSNCGLTGVFFAKERTKTKKAPLIDKWHLNLYAINEKGEEVLMTKDHIFPKSKGGTDDLWNFRTMCCRCNEKKRDKISDLDYDEVFPFTTMELGFSLGK